MSRRRLLIWRHGRTEWNATSRVQGQQDVALDEVGVRQAAEAAPLLALERPELIVSSDLRRAHDTAKALAEHLGLEITLDKRIRERCFGDWEGLSSTELAEQYPEAYARWRAGHDPEAPGIESQEQMTARIASAIEDALDATTGTVCLVTHGGAVKRALADLFGWPADVPWGLEPLGNCRWAALQRRNDTRWRLQSYNVGVTAPVGAASSMPASADVEPDIDRSAPPVATREA